MQTMVATTSYPALSEPVPKVGLRCELSLRSAAATVAQPWPDRGGATHCGPARIVGTLGCDNPSAVNTLVAELARAFELDASVRFDAGYFLVRFSRQPSR